MGFLQDIKQRILVLDGAMGTMLQRGFSPEEVLRMYVDAGADIITTDTFTANRISQESLGQRDSAASMAYEAALVARKVADTASRKVYVAGSCGPTGKSLTLASDASDQAYREFSFDDFVEAYKEQISALQSGGVDLILLETCFDALNAKALIYAMEKLGNPLPLVISATVSDRSGRTLTGQTLEAFYRSVSHAPTLVAFGVNCALGAREMAPLVREIASFSSHPVIFYPNAGLPDEFGAYTDSAEEMAGVIAELASEGSINIAGGCCGTTPEHISAISKALSSCRPHVCEASSELVVSGLEAVRIDRKLNFTNIGERTNVAGSRKFARLISECNYKEALRIASDQIAGGADIIDINMDDPMLDSSEKLRVFLRHIAGEPDIAKAAVMIDSSHWETILEGLKNTQGRCIVNSISLKDGEDEFLRKAREIKAFGAVIVVMAFDEKGQAVTFERKVEICRRSYELLTVKAGIPARDIIFDCNILSIGTGIPEHSRFGIDFIEAVRWIKSNLKDARTSGGLSNLSFAFRGNNAVREAMHSAFLYHAIRAGLDMAIVNPQMLRVYDDIPEDLRKAVEDVIFDSDEQATSRLIDIASHFSSDSRPEGKEDRIESAEDPMLRLPSSIVKGDSSFLEPDVLACKEKLGSAVKVIEGPLMKGMELVGTLFSEGKMFLPQVVKSAKLMRDAVAVLRPYMGGDETVSKKPRFVIATVQGDVHDIGKNITSIVLQCSGFEVVDLGVMVPCRDILDKAEEIGADAVGVSGLITPSLHRMEEICAEMSLRGMSIPLFVGGAAASAVHTAVKLAPLYPNVHYGSDASSTAVMAKKCLADPESFLTSESEVHKRLRDLRASAIPQCSCCHAHDEGDFPAGKPFADIPFMTLSSDELLPHFDWKMFFAVCGAGNGSESIRQEALNYLSKENPAVRVSARFFDCRRENDDIVGESIVFPMLRDRNTGACLADFLPEGRTSQFGVFAACVPGICNDDIVGHSVRVTLAEAASAWLSERLASGLPEGMKLILPGIGYSCCPDHSLKRDVLSLLSDELEIRLTDSCAMVPEASVCGFVFAHNNASYPEIRTVSASSLDAYAEKRHMNLEEKSLFLGNFLEK